MYTSSLEVLDIHNSILSFPVATGTVRTIHSLSVARPYYIVRTSPFTSAVTLFSHLRGSARFTASLHVCLLCSAVLCYDLFCNWFNLQSIQKTLPWVTPGAGGGTSSGLAIVEADV
jgi:hypothetical protein